MMKNRELNQLRNMVASRQTHQSAWHQGIRHRYRPCSVPLQHVTKVIQLEGCGNDSNDPERIAQLMTSFPGQ